jgi:Sulfatase
MPLSSPAADLQDHRLRLLLAAWLGLAGACFGVMLSVPQPWRALDQPLALSAAAALVAYIDRRRLADALVMALPPLAGPWVDTELGAQALLVASLTLYLLTRRPRFAAVAGSAAVALLLAGVQLKQRFAGTPLTWQDLRFFFSQFGDNLGVLGTQPTLVAWAGGAVGLALLVCAAAWAWEGPGRPVGRAGPIVAAALAGLLLGHHAGLMAQGVAALGSSGAWFVASGLQDRPLIGFFATRTLQPRWQGPAVDTQDFRRASQRWISAGTSAPPADIVVILQESQFNPATLAGCSPRTCQVEAFSANGQTLAHGPLQVHTFGGGTWLSEFTLQTGVPHDAFGPAGEFASFSIAPHVRRSLARSLKAAGYRTVALYPTRGGMMNGRTAHAGYGFDEFLDAAQLGLPEAWGTPDALVHEAARRVLAEQRRHGQPVFLFVETLFNHAEHGVEMDRVPPALRAAAARDFASEDEARSVADYVWRSREFAREMATTRQAVLGTTRPSVLAWFGDHQPPFANAQSLRQKVQPLPTPTGQVAAKYQTWYDVSSNRAPRGGPAVPSALDLAFLPGVLAQAAGAPLDDWLAANVQARVGCEGLLQACRATGGREAYLAHLWGDLRGFDLP